MAFLDLVTRTPCRARPQAHYVVSASGRVDTTAVPVELAFLVTRTLITTGWKPERGS